MATKKTVSTTNRDPAATRRAARSRVDSSAGDSGAVRARRLAMGLGIIGFIVAVLVAVLILRLAGIL